MFYVGYTVCPYVSVQNAGVVVMTDGFVHEAESTCKNTTYPLYSALMLLNGCVCIDAALCSLKTMSLGLSSDQKNAICCLKNSVSERVKSSGYQFTTVVH